GGPSERVTPSFQAPDEARDRYGPPPEEGHPTRDAREHRASSRHPVEVETMHYTAVVTKEGKQTLAEFPGCPGCQTFADPGEDIAERAEEALAGWLEAQLVSGQAPPEPKKLRLKGR